jgi:hypothetical protein
LLRTTRLGACGAGGIAKQHVWKEKIKAQIQSMGNAEVMLNATFCEGLEAVLLGRNDFFNAYKVSFDNRAETFTLEPYE